jgi:kynureninase
MADLAEEKLIHYKEDISYARAMDENDPLRSFRDKFYIPQKNGEDAVYFAGNSLGLQPKSTRDYIEQELSDWQKLAVDGHFHAKYPWKYYHEFLTEKTARMIGAEDDEVVNMNSLTVNLNLMMVSFYRPTKERYKIIMEANAFPSDIYAVESHIKFHGYDPKDALLVPELREGESYHRTEDILSLIDEQGDSIALVMIAGVNYYSGQAFDMKAITEAGHKKGCKVGFDLAHAAGNLKMNLHDWDVDFAVWCNYKYLNSGPGAVAGCFVHSKHKDDFEMPRFSGWWGHKKETRFLMPSRFDPSQGVEGWQISNPPIFQMAALNASLEIFDEAGMEALRNKSKMLTGYAEYILNNTGRSSIEIITPEDPEQRGCQLSLRVGKGNKHVHTTLNENSVICDWREPDVIRIAPVPLYNKFEDVWKFVDIIKRHLTE